jgi:hypothetical protein
MLVYLLACLPPVATDAERAPFDDMSHDEPEPTTDTGNPDSGEPGADSADSGPVEQDTATDTSEPADSGEAGDSGDSGEVEPDLCAEDWGWAELDPATLYYREDDPGAMWSFNLEGYADVCSLSCTDWWASDPFIQEPGGRCDTAVTLPFALDGIAEFCVRLRWPGAADEASCEIVTSAGVVSLAIVAS